MERILLWPLLFSTSPIVSELFMRPSQPLAAGDPVRGVSQYSPSFMQQDSQKLIADELVANSAGNPVETCSFPGFDARQNACEKRLAPRSEEHTSELQSLR